MFRFTVDLSSLSAVSCAYVASSRGADCWQSKQSRIMFQRLLHLTDLYSSLSFHVRAPAAVSSRLERRLRSVIYRTQPIKHKDNLRQSITVQRG